MINNISKINNNFSNYDIPPVGLFNQSRQQKHTFEAYYNIYYNSNLFNICYMNSCIQCFFHLDKFVFNLFNNKGRNLLNASKKLLNQMINFRYLNKKILSVQEIKECMSQLDERYKNYNQEDVNEFISDYLDGLLEETKTNGTLSKPKNSDFQNQNEYLDYLHFFERFYAKKGNSFIIDLFFGELRIKRYCNQCNLLFSAKFSAYNILELPIYYLSLNNTNSSLNLKDIIKNYISPSKNNDIQCIKCKEGIYSQTEIYKLPKYLILYFGRTINNTYISHKIIFPKQLDLYDFVYKKTFETENNNNYSFELRGVIYYSSYGLNNGHYTAACRCNKKEFYFDDSEVVELEKANIIGEPIVLFYEKIN